MAHSADRDLRSLGREFGGVILLGGTLRRNVLSQAAGRSLLDLPLDSTERIIDLWSREIAALAKALGRKSVPARLILDSRSLAPEPERTARGAPIRVEREPTAYRGTAGLLRDALVGEDRDRIFLVASAAQILVESLPSIVRTLEAARRGLAGPSRGRARAASNAQRGKRSRGEAADVTVSVHRDGTLSSFVLLRARCLERVAPVGYIDMKEQLLPALAEERSVAVATFDAFAGLPIRTAPAYIRALRTYYALRRAPEDGRDTEPDRFPDCCRSIFSIVEDGARVASDTWIQDSVVLTGAEIAPGATVVRSVVCPGARVGRRVTVTERLVEPSRGIFSGRAASG